MLKASNLKKGNIININNKPWQVKKIDVHTPSARGANTLYKVRYAGIPGGQKLEKNYKGNDSLDEMVLERRTSSFLYKDQNLYTFMDSENYEQYTLSEESLEDQIKWLVDDLQGITALLLDGVILCIELPSNMNLEIIETAPSIKGATATSQSKPATLSNNHEVQVPEYMSTGDIVQVNTDTGDFMARVKA
ncbi:MAG: elongation factor P-like protein YeiP [Thermodesulfobacteriota bacterium]|nr:elongation factor P-like protein YeiP [Thermodesulfobacteriota bacterium]